MPGYTIYFMDRRRWRHLSRGPLVEARNGDPIRYALRIQELCVTERAESFESSSSS